MKSNILTTLLKILLSFPLHAGWFDSSVSSNEIINQNGLAYLKKTSDIINSKLLILRRNLLSNLIRIVIIVLHCSYKL